VDPFGPGSFWPDPDTEVQFTTKSVTILFLTHQEEITKKISAVLQKCLDIKMETIYPNSG
jgi:hypothetical protein